MEYKDIPIIIIGSLIFLFLFCFIMDIIYSSKEEDESYIVNQSPQSYEPIVSDDIDYDESVVLLNEENDFYSNELDSLS